MNDVIMWIMAAGAVIGGLDRILNNRFGLGEKFEQGFMYLGPTALSMAGVICLAPVLSELLGAVIAPLYRLIGVDPAMFGGILAIDMGGFQLARDLAEKPLLGAYAGIVVAAVFGCTVTFTIPVGMGVVEKGDRSAFARGMLFGLIAMPVALLCGGLACGLSVREIIWQNVPVVALSALLLAGIWRAQEKMIRGFSVFARGIQILTTIGLIAGAVQYMTGWGIIPGLAPIEEAMAVVSSIGVVMLGSLTVAELLQRLLKRPLEALGRKLGMNSASVAGLLIGAVSVLPSIALMKDMDARGKVVNAAFIVSAASLLAAHLGFTVSAAPDMVVPLLAAKLAGGFAGAAIALLATRKQ